MARQKQPSSNRAISANVSIGKGKGSIGIGYIALTLFDVDAQLYFSLGRKGGSVGGGIPFGLTASTVSPSSFTTPTLMWVKDFDGRFVNISGAELAVGVGGGLTYVTFLSISHEPTWLDIGGVESGVAGGARGCIGVLLTRRAGKIWGAAFNQMATRCAGANHPPRNTVARIQGCRLNNLKRS